MYPNSASDLAADLTNVDKRFQVVESQTSICRAAAALAPARADQECDRAAQLMHETRLDPTNAGFRGYLAGAYSDLAEVYDSLATHGRPADRRLRHLAALDLYRQSSSIWSDLETRGLVNPTDTGRVTAARRAVAQAEIAVKR
jgi:hypothetical protein